MMEPSVQLRLEKGYLGKWSIDMLIGHLKAIQNHGITHVDVKLEKFNYTEDIIHTRLLITN